MTETFTVKRVLYSRTDSRLGRHVNHDSRSLNYSVAAAPISDLKSVRHERYIPILDQGNLGSCTGNAATACLGSGFFWSTIQDKDVLSATDSIADEKYAVDVYAKATAIDPYAGTYPPKDTGSDGLSVAKVLQSRGLISGYQHATSLAAVLTALAKQPVIVGTEWFDDMFNPAKDGAINVSGSLAGGHEYLLDELDVENQRVWMANSWNEDWGVGGRAYFTWKAFEDLLGRAGDCTVFTPISQPSPTPTPPSPPAPPEPAPPAPPEPDRPTAEFVQAAMTFEKALHKYLGE